MKTLRVGNVCVGPRAARDIFFEWPWEKGPGVNISV